MESEFYTGRRVAALALATLMVTASDARADDPPASPGEKLEEFQRRADDLTAQAEETIQDFINLIGPMIERLSVLIDDLPAYEAPEILPNGDIILRRKRDVPAPLDTPEKPGSTET